MKSRLLISVSMAALLCSAVAVRAQTATYEQTLDQVAQSYGITRSDLSTETQALVKGTMDAATALTQASKTLDNANEIVADMTKGVTAAQSHVPNDTAALKAANDELAQVKAKLSVDQKLYSNSQQLQQNLTDAIAKQKTADYWAEQATKSFNDTKNLPSTDPRRQQAIAGYDNAIKLQGDAHAAAEKAADDVKGHGLTTLQADQAAINVAQAKVADKQATLARTQDEVKAAQANLAGAVVAQKTAADTQQKAFTANQSAASTLFDHAKNDAVRKIATQQAAPANAPMNGIPASALANQPNKAPPLAGGSQVQPATPGAAGATTIANAPLINMDGAGAVNKANAALINMDGAGVVGPGGASAAGVVGHNASALINMDGAGVVGPGGASAAGVVGHNASALIGELGGALTGNKAAPLISNNPTAGLVTDNGSAIVTDQGAGLVHVMSAALQTTTAGGAVFKQNSQVTAFTNVDTPSDQLKRSMNNLSGAEIKALTTLQKQVDSGQTLSPADQAKVKTIWDKATKTLDKGTIQQLDSQAKAIAAVEATHKANTQALGTVVVQQAIQRGQNDPAVASAAQKIAAGQALTPDEAKHVNTAVNKVVNTLAVPAAQKQALTQSANTRVVTLAKPAPAPAQAAAPAPAPTLAETQARALQTMQQMQQDALRKGDTASAAAMATNIEALQKAMAQPAVQTPAAPAAAAAAPAGAPNASPQPTHAPAVPTLASAPAAEHATHAEPPAHATHASAPAAAHATHAPAPPAHPQARADVPERHMPRTVTATPHHDVKVTAPHVHTAAPTPPKVAVAAPKAPPPPAAPIRH